MAKAKAKSKKSATSKKKETKKPKVPPARRARKLARAINRSLVRIVDRCDNAKKLLEELGKLDQERVSESAQEKIGNAVEKAETAVGKVQPLLESKPKKKAKKNDEETKKGKKSKKAKADEDEEDEDEEDEDEDDEDEGDEDEDDEEDDEDDDE